MVNSTTAAVGLSGVFVTQTLYFFAEFKSILSRPIPTLDISFNLLIFLVLFLNNFQGQQ